MPSSDQDVLTVVSARVEPVSAQKVSERCLSVSSDCNLESHGEKTADAVSCEHSSPGSGGNTSDSAVGFSSSDTNSSSSPSPSIQDDATSSESGHVSLSSPTIREGTTGEERQNASGTRKAQLNSEGSDVISASIVTACGSKESSAIGNQHQMRWSANENISMQNRSSNGNCAANQPAGVKPSAQELGGNQQYACYQGAQQSANFRTSRLLSTAATQQPLNNHIYYNSAQLTQPFVSNWYPTVENFHGQQVNVLHPAYSDAISSFSTQAAQPFQSALYTASPPHHPSTFAHFPLNQQPVYPAGHFYSNGEGQTHKAGPMPRHHFYPTFGLPVQSTYWPNCGGGSQPPVYYYSLSQSNNATQHLQQQVAGYSHCQQEPNEFPSKNSTSSSQQLSEPDEASNGKSGGKFGSAQVQAKALSISERDNQHNSSTSDGGNCSKPHGERIPQASGKDDKCNDISGATSGVAETLLIGSSSPEAKPIEGSSAEVGVQSSKFGLSNSDNVVRDKGNYHEANGSEVAEREEQDYLVKGGLAYQDSEPARQQAAYIYTPAASESAASTPMSSSSSPGPSPVQKHRHEPPKEAQEKVAVVKQDEAPSSATTSDSTLSQCFRSPTLNVQQPHANPSLLSYMLPAPLLGQNLLPPASANYTPSLAPHYAQTAHHPATPFVPSFIFIPPNPARPNYAPAHYTNSRYQKLAQDTQQAAIATSNYYLQQSGSYHLYPMIAPLQMDQPNVGVEGCYYVQMLYPHPLDNQLTQSSHQYCMNTATVPITAAQYKPQFQTPYFFSPAGPRSHQMAFHYSAPFTAADYASTNTMNRATTMDGGSGAFGHYYRPQPTCESRYFCQQPYHTNKVSFEDRTTFQAPPMIAFSPMRLDYNLISLLPIDACPTRTRQAYGMDKVWRDEFEQLFSQLANNIVWTLIEVESNPSIRDSVDIIGYKGRYIVRICEDESASSRSSVSDKACTEVCQETDDDKESCCSNPVEHNTEGAHSGCDRSSNETPADQPQTGDTEELKTDLLVARGGETESDCDSGAQLDLTSGGSSTGAISELEGDQKGSSLSQPQSVAGDSSEDKCPNIERTCAPLKKFPTRFKMFIDSAKVRFCCDHCGHGWTSMKGRVVFWYELFELVRETDSYTGSTATDWAGNENTNLIGYCAYKLFGQQCDVCKIENRFERPMWYPEEVSKVLNNLHNKIGQIYFGVKMPAIDKQRRAGKPKTSHNSSLCQACHDGVCTDRK